MKLDPSESAATVAIGERAFSAVRELLAGKMADVTPPLTEGELDQNAAVIVIQSAISIMTERHSVPDAVQAFGIAFGVSLAHVPDPGLRSHLIQIFGRAMNHAGRGATEELRREEPILGEPAGRA